jgi:uncharacterized protein (TIGR02996 family)
MNVEALLLAAIRAAPGDLLTWQALGDHLEEQGDPRAEVLRLDLQLRQHLTHPQRRTWERRLQTLLGKGIRPCVPTLTNSLGMTFALVPPGSAQLGSGRWRTTNSERVRTVAIARPFYLGIGPVTQDQYTRVIGSNPSWFAQGGEHAEAVVGMDTASFPVDNIPWQEAVDFCRRLSERDEERQAGRRYRLPWEVEWEYACRSGTQSAYHFGSRAATRWGRFSWKSDAPSQNRGRTCPVGSYPPNAWGLFDMHGQVWEHCGEPYYAKPADTQLADWEEPTPGIGLDGTTVMHGGSWANSPQTCQAHIRSSCTPGFHSGWVGLRVVLVPAETSESGLDGRRSRS